MSADQKANVIKSSVLEQLKAALILGGDDLSSSDLKCALESSITLIEKASTSEARKDDNSKPYNYNDEYESSNPDREYDENDDYYNEDEYSYNDESYGYENDEDYKRNIPEGFKNEKQYDKFLKENAPDENKYYTDVVGVRITKKGKAKEIGNIEESLNRIPVSDDIHEKKIFVNVRFRRESGEELTKREVEEIVLAHRMSAPMLEVFGTNYKIRSGDKDSEKIVSFKMGKKNDGRKNQLARNILTGNGAAFNGKYVFPALGMIESSVITIEDLLENEWK